MENQLEINAEQFPLEQDRSQVSNIWADWKNRILQTEDVLEYFVIPMQDI